MQNKHQNPSIQEMKKSLYRAGPMLAGLGILFSKSFYVLEAVFEGFH